MKCAALIILDGFGVAPQDAANPRSRAKTPTLDYLEQGVFGVTLEASGIGVGLPWGEPGNSEVGHLTIGSGRLFYHHLPRIIMAIRDGSFYTNPALLGAFSHARSTGGTVHVMGIVSSGSVHAYIDHLYALFEMAQREGMPVALHVFTDGRDAAPREAEKFLPQIEDRMRVMGVGRIVSVCGRHYAMDRSGAWDLTETCYRHLTGTVTRVAPTVVMALRQAYADGVGDEQISPTIIASAEQRQAPVFVRSGDALIFFNFREDSARQIAEAFSLPQFSRFPRQDFTQFQFVTMTEYEKGLAAGVAFPTIALHDTFGEILAREGLTQLRVAETEKYAHVTYFFNGGIEPPLPGEQRILIPSYSGVPHDTVPDMRAAEIADEVVRAIETKSHDVIVANLANGDLVGHTGNFAACARALEALDGALSRIVSACRASDTALFITADHGNVEAKIDLMTGRPLTEHSLNPVPFFILDSGVAAESTVLKKLKSGGESDGLLTDVAPTIFAALGIAKPDAMSGQDLLQRHLT